MLGADPRTAGPQLRRRIGFLPGELRLDDRLRVDETLAAAVERRDIRSA